MYKKETQLAFEDFVFPFGELDSEMNGSNWRA